MEGQNIPSDREGPFQDIKYQVIHYSKQLLINYYSSIMRQLSQIYWKLFCTTGLPVRTRKIVC